MRIQIHADRDHNISTQSFLPHLHLHMYISTWTYDDSYLKRKLCLRPNGGSSLATCPNTNPKLLCAAINMFYDDHLPHLKRQQQQGGEGKGSKSKGPPSSRHRPQGEPLTLPHFVQQGPPDMILASAPKPSW
mmetsp:Transcript_8574/g.22983  ORF Transcript_8574/g.22983 Transcript_8574/m.22983 type:complete len:132 (-) Transcript_8574:7111-7506(-)